MAVVNALLLAIHLSIPAPAATPLAVTHGIAVGEPQTDGALVWARASRRARMWVEALKVGAKPEAMRRWRGPLVDEAGDYTGKVKLDKLDPGAEYLYWVRFEAEEKTSARSGTGRLKTLPATETTSAITMVWWGDLGGQSYCRAPGKGYALFRVMEAAAPDLAIASGDSIYADGTCPAAPGLPGQPANILSDDPTTAAYQGLSASTPGLTAAETLAAVRAKWRYNLEDESYRAFRARTPHLYQWDDHEVINDWFPGEGRAALAEAGRRSFLEYSPLEPGPGGTLYRGVRLGKLAEVFMLDNRGLRNDNTKADDGKKSMLGEAQRRWLLATLTDAQARGVVWKIIATSDPLASPTGKVGARDGWAAGDDAPQPVTGFESELRSILLAVKAAGIKNLLWLTADTHCARITRFRPGEELAGLDFHELMSGPVNAISGTLGPMSPALAPEELFAWGVPAGEKSPDYFNFGWLRIDADGTLKAEIRGTRGETITDARGRRGALELKPVP
jgi:alkaline phosphatase D